MKDAGQILKEVLGERQAANASYSLRAFARDLDLSPQQVSNVINGRRGLSSLTASRVAAIIGLDDHQKIIFFESLKAKFSLKRADRIVARAKLAHEGERGVQKSLSIDMFKTISNWHHLAILELLKLPSAKNLNQINWLSRKVGISDSEIKIALARLERLELITKCGTSYRVNQDTVISDQGIPSEAVKLFHKQILDKATSALAFQNAEERYGSSSLFPVKVKSLKRATKLIQEFRLNFAKEISDEEGGEEIYGLCLQFMRVTQLVKE